MSQVLKNKFQGLAAAPTAMGLASQLALSRIKRENIDPVPLLRRTNLSQISLDERRRISVPSQISFLSEAVRVLGDEWFGLSLATQLDLREIGMVYYVATSSSGFRDALSRLVRYGRVVSEALELRVDNQGGVLRLAVSFKGFSRHTDRHQAEFVALVLLRVCRKLMGNRIIPLSVSLAHHRSGDLAQIKSLFGCDVQFDAYSDGLTFDATVLDLPVIGADPFLNELLVGLCEQAITARVSTISPFRTLVENTISPLLPHGEATADNVARRLGVSERTFARRLAAEGTSFGLILDGLRHELAITYMQDGLQASQIAWLLGFHQSSSFTHACKRWTGSTPSQYRRLQPIQ